MSEQKQTDSRIKLKNLKRSRLAKELSRKELAAKAGVSVQVISSAEFGFKTDPKEAQAIATALGVKLTSLAS